MSKTHDYLLARFVAFRVRLIERGDGGVGLVEYALLVALIVLVCISAITFFGQATASKMAVPPSSF